MLFVNLINFLKGYIIIKVSGRFPERFLNVCANKGVLLWNITRNEEQTVICTVSMKAFSEVAPIARKTGVNIDVISRHGLSFLLKKYKKRKWFAIGMLIFFVSVLVLNQFVWDIEITGCEKLSKTVVEKNLSELGVKIGTPRFMIDERILKDKMLLKMPELSWIWVDKRGSRLLVTLRESVPAPEIFDMDDYSNIIAKKDGIVKSMTITSGTPLVEIGDTVLKNDILVSGLMISERGIEPRYIQADGSIYASVWYEKSEKYPLYETKKVETGNVQKVRNIKIFGLSFVPFWYEKPNYTYCDKESKISSLEIFGRYLGITVETDIYREYNIEKILLDEESAQNAAVLSLLEKIDMEADSDSEVSTYSFRCERNDDETITVTVIAEYLENIGEKVRVGQ